MAKTVKLPPALHIRAKIRAAKLGKSLMRFVAEAVQAALTKERIK